MVRRSKTLKIWMLLNQRESFNWNKKGDGIPANSFAQVCIRTSFDFIAWLLSQGFTMAMKDNYKMSSWFWKWSVTKLFMNINRASHLHSFYTGQKKKLLTSVFCLPIHSRVEWMKSSVVEFINRLLLRTAVMEEGHPGRHAILYCLRTNTMKSPVTLPAQSCIMHAVYGLYTARHAKNVC